MNILWPDNYGMDSITCNGYRACVAIDFPIPDPSQQLILNCDEWNECGLSNIYCPTNASCNINCKEKSACAQVCVSIGIFCQVYMDILMHINRPVFTVHLMEIVISIVWVQPHAQRQKSTQTNHIHII